MKAALQRKCACGGTPGPAGECAECRKKRLGLQRREAAPALAAAPAVVPEIHRAPRGHDFGKVRVHALQRRPTDRDLPYRESTELLKCNQTLKDPEYCRQAVLGEEPVGQAPGAGCGRFTVEMRPALKGTGIGGKIVFHPDPKRCPKCKSIRLIQTVRIFDKPGQQYIWKGDEAGREKVKTREDQKKGVKEGYFIDHLSEECTKGKGCGVYYRDHAPNSMLSGDGSNNGKTAAPASLLDAPSGDANDIFEFETCARCHDTGRFLGCVDWGFTADSEGKAALSLALQHDTPSATFTAAVQTFNQYYKNKGR